MAHSMPTNASTIRLAANDNPHRETPTDFAVDCSLYVKRC